MTGKSLPFEVRYAIDTVLRKRMMHTSDFVTRYDELLDEITAEVMSVIWQAD